MEPTVERSKTELCRELMSVEVQSNETKKFDVCFVKPSPDEPFVAFKKCSVSRENGYLSFNGIDIKDEVEYSCFNPFSVLILPVPKYLR